MDALSAFDFGHIVNVGCGGCSAASGQGIACSQGPCRPETHRRKRCSWQLCLKLQQLFTEEGSDVWMLLLLWWVMQVLGSGSGAHSGAPR